MTVITKKYYALKCMKACKKAESILREQEDQSVIAQLARDVLKDCKAMLELGDAQEEIYHAVNGITENLFEHPRLKLELKQVALQAVESLEKRDQEDYEEGAELRKEIEQLKSNIQAADEGRFRDIKSDSILKKDPIEWTKEFEAVVDKAEHRAYQQLKGVPRGMGFCFEYWAARRAALQELGIEWRSPHEMNPRVMFD